MLCLFKSITFECLCYFRVAFTVCLTTHSKIHTDLTTFTVEVRIQIFNHLLISTFFAGSTYNMNSFKIQALRFYQLRKFTFGSLANWTFLWWFSSFINIATYGTNKLLFHFTFNLIFCFLFPYIQHIFLYNKSDFQ